MSKTKNDNCLEGLRCPNCGSLEPFSIRVEATLVMTDDGADFPGDNDMDMQIDWNDNADCFCLKCRYRGTVQEYKVKVVKNE